MTTFLLIRHATNDYVGKSLVGWRPGVHLNEEGRAQAARLAERLSHAPISALYSSPLERALETAEPLAGRLGLTIEVCREFGELNFGEWTGRTIEELDPLPEWRRFNTFRSVTRIPGGELMGEVQNRMATGLERLRERHPGQMVAVVSHGDAIRAAFAFYAGIPIDLCLRVEISPASVTAIAVDENGPRILRVNDTGER